jgi:hypothetical protein
MLPATKLQASSLVLPIIADFTKQLPKSSLVKSGWLIKYRTCSFVVHIIHPCSPSLLQTLYYNKWNQLKYQLQQSRAFCNIYYKKKFDLEFIMYLTIT